MKLTPALEKRYTADTLSAREAQRLAELVAFGPVVFQAARLLRQWGLLALMRESDDGLTVEEMARKSSRSPYAVRVLCEAGLTAGLLLIHADTERYRLSKAGWFLLTDELTGGNMDFNHDVNYQGLFYLDQALSEGRPAGLQVFGQWPTIYEGLSELPPSARRSWFAFDHFYSDHAFDQALPIVFARPTRHLMDIGGNTGRWARRCVAYDTDVHVTVVDLPQQLDMLRGQTQNTPGGERIGGHAANMLDEAAALPATPAPDAIWMSQFLDCFAPEEIVRILSKAAQVMTADSRLYIMETLWDRQKYEPAAMCLTQISLYFSAMANGNSKMYTTDQMTACIDRAGLQVEQLHDNLGHGHTIIVCRKDS